jgi:SulP family sulfate permease
VDSAATRSAGSTLAQLAGLVERLGGVRPAPLLLGVMVMVAATLAARWSPRAPAPLVGVVTAIVVARFFGFHEREIGATPGTLPPFAGFSWSPRDVLTVLPSAFALAFVSSVNILITSRVVEHFRGRHKRAKRPTRTRNWEPTGSPISAPACLARRSASEFRRAAWRWSAAAAPRGGQPGARRGAGRDSVVGFGAVSHIPLPALAGVTAWMGLCLLDWSTWRRLPKMSRVDAAAFLATAVSVLAVNAVLAVAIGCSVYALKFVYVRWVRPESGFRICRCE